MDEYFFIVKSVDRKVSPMSPTKEPKQKPPEGANVMFDFHVHRWEFKKGLYDIGLIFQMKYFPKAYLEDYVLYANVEMKVDDLKGFLKEAPYGDESVSLFSHIYLETFESLSNHLERGAKEQLHHGFLPRQEINEEEALAEIKRVLTLYFESQN